MDTNKMTIIITGISSGIGLALANDYLEKGHTVIGIGRTNIITHKQLMFFTTDLSQSVDFSFLDTAIQDAHALMLINNAGTIGTLERISEQQTSDIVDTMQLNAIAPMLLCQHVLRQFPLDRKLTIVNISSGAGKRPVPSWASYCASKAAIDLFSQTIFLEEQERGRLIRVYSVAPGVVDTPMQEQIRTASNESFSAVESFRELHKTHALTTVSEVVRKLNALLHQAYDQQVIYSLRDIV